MDLNRPRAPEDGRSDDAHRPSGDARLPSALARTLAGATRRLRGVHPPAGTSGDRAGPVDDPGYDEALRRAFRAAIPVEPTQTAPWPGSEHEPATEDSSSRPVVTPAGAVSPAAAAAPPAATDLLGDKVARNLKARGLVTGELDADALDESEATRHADPTDELDSTRAVGPLDAVPASAAGAPSADGISRANVREPGPTAPEDLLEVPESVGATVDDFFGGLVQRVERRA